MKCKEKNLTRSQNPLRPAWAARKAEWGLAKSCMKLEGLLGDLWNPSGACCPLAHLEEWTRRCVVLKGSKRILTQLDPEMGPEERV